MLGEEVDERADDRIGEAAQGPERWLLVQHHIGAGRLGREQGCDRAQCHQHRHANVRHRPSDTCRRGDDQGVGDEQGDAVTNLRRRGHQPHFVSVGRRLDAPGVDRDVLRGRGEGRQQCEGADGREPARRPHSGHAQQPDGDQNLAQQHPAATPAEAAQQRDVDAVHQRRPVHFEGIGKADPGDKPDGNQARAVVPQPVAEGVGG